MSSPGWKRSFPNNMDDSHPRNLNKPAAVVLLSARRSLGQIWNGIPVVCEDVKPKSLDTKDVRALGVIVNKDAVQGFDL